MSLGEVNHRLVILFSGTKSFCELGNAKKMAVIWAGWVVDLLEQISQFTLVPEREHNREIHPPIRWKRPDHCRLTTGNRVPYVMMQDLERLLREGWNRKQQDSAQRNQEIPRPQTAGTT
jgi:hypothetical protein